VAAGLTGFDSWKRQRCFFTNMSRAALGLTQPPFNRYRKNFPWSQTAEA